MMNKKYITRVEKNGRLIYVLLCAFILVHGYDMVSFLTRGYTLSYWLKNIIHDDTMLIFDVAIAGVMVFIICCKLNYLRVKSNAITYGKRCSGRIIHVTKEDRSSRAVKMTDYILSVQLEDGMIVQSMNYAKYPYEYNSCDVYLHKEYAILDNFRWE